MSEPKANEWGSSLIGRTHFSLKRKGLWSKARGIVVMRWEITCKVRVRINRNLQPQVFIQCAVTRSLFKKGSVKRHFFEGTFRYLQWEFSKTTSNYRRTSFNYSWMMLFLQSQRPESSTYFSLMYHTQNMTNFLFTVQNHCISCVRDWFHIDNFN